MSNIFTVIRDAVRPGAQTHALDLVEGEPGAQALNSTAPHQEALIEGANMSANQAVPGAAQAAAATIAAVAAPGGADGFKAATDRMSAVLGAEGIKGDGKRMSAALDLAVASPGMAADAVVAFVTANVPAANAAAATVGAQAAVPPAAAQPQLAASSYEAQVQAAASLAMPGGGKPSAGSSINRDAIFAARRATQKGA